jgi:hypothetical protein
MAEDQNVSVVSWPKEPAGLAHQFDPENPVPVTIRFGETPVRVFVASDPERPLDVDMNMNVTAKEPIPVCIKLCEPICARSDYTIGINIFDNPFASITVRGMTKIGACGEEPPTNQLTCVNFDRLKVGMTFPGGLDLDGLKFSPLGGELRAVSFGEPAGRIKLGFADAGLRVDFPQPVEDVRLTLNDYAQPELIITAFAGAAVLTTFTVTINNTVREVAVPASGVTAVTVSGGSNEAALVEVCYRVAA